MSGGPMHVKAGWVPGQVLEDGRTVHEWGSAVRWSRAAEEMIAGTMPDVAQQQLENTVRRKGWEYQQVEFLTGPRHKWATAPRHEHGHGKYLAVCADDDPDWFMQDYAMRCLVAVPKGAQL